MFSIEGDYRAVVARLFIAKPDGTLQLGNALSTFPATEEQLKAGVEFREFLMEGSVTFLIRLTDTAPGVLLEIGTMGTNRDKYIPIALKQHLLRTGLPFIDLLETDENAPA